MVKSKFQKVDSMILNFCSLKIKNKYFDRIMPLITHCNDFGVFYLGLILLSIIVNYKTNLAVNVLLALTFGLLLGEGMLKHLIRRNRPQFRNPIDSLLVKIPRTSSFPSGHTTSSFAALGVLWGMDSNLIYVFLIAAILISFSRLYLYLHYPSDVMGGIALGLLCSKVVIIMANSGYIVNAVMKAINKLYCLL